MRENLGWVFWLVILLGVPAVMYLQRDKIGFGAADVPGGTGAASVGEAAPRDDEKVFRQICEADMARTVAQPQTFRDKYGYDIRVDRCELRKTSKNAASDGEIYWMGEGVCHMSDGKSVEEAACLVLQCANGSFPKPDRRTESLGDCRGRPDAFGRRP